MNSGSEVFVYSGRELLGMVKALPSGSYEAFAANTDGEQHYLGKTPTRRKAISLIQLRGRPQGAPHHKLEMHP
ncbi:MAG TPA: hypothetical protein VIL72_02060 [Beijerinckiaceae bacterium]|jgi:hypothetical protein